MLQMPAPELIERYGRPGPRYTSYPAATEWTTDIGVAQAEAALAAADAKDAPLSVYVHLPFCVEMCRFCGCNVIATCDVSRADTYLDVIEKEVALWAARLPHRRHIGQLHLGGGTPTFLTTGQLFRLHEILFRHFSLDVDADLAVEVDPEVTTTGHLNLLAGLGYRRISLGVQDLNPRVQAAIGRIQSEANTRGVIDAARADGFGSVNLDLMYGLPHQTPDSMSETLDRLLTMKPDRMALFGYAHVPWVKPNQRLLPQAYLPSGPERVALFVSASNRLEKEGYRQIGLDHFAKPGDELARAQDDGTLTRNFQGYSARVPPDVVAFGMSAISDINGVNFQNAHKLSDWERKINSGKLAVERGLRRTEDDELRGEAIRELMCLLHVDFKSLSERFGAESVGRMREDAAAGLAECERDGLIESDQNSIAVLPPGRIFLRNIAMPFDAYLGKPEGKQAFSKTV